MTIAMLLEMLKGKEICAGSKLNSIEVEDVFKFNDSEFLKLLKKRSSIGICFDNDDAGRTGATELKTLLESKGIQNVNIVDLSDVCTLKGEDLADYFLKYQGDVKTLIKRAMGVVS